MGLTVEVRRELQDAYQEIGAPSDGIYCFVFSSLDLVNSTAYKSREPIKWPSLTKEFYRKVQQTSEALADNEAFQGLLPRIWKFVGDEVVLYTEVFSEEEAIKVARLTDDLCRQLHCEFSNKDQAEKRRATRLGVKGTCWIALVGDKEPISQHDSSSAKNIRLNPGALPTIDFLGPDIDIGFRIGKSAIRGAVVLSAQLALLACQDEDMSTRMRHVGFEPLKGVWSGRPYPIVWFRHDWDGFFMDFDYDEKHDNPALAAASARHLVDEKAFKKILAEVDQDIEPLRAYLLANADKRPQPHDAAEHYAPEVHLVAAVVDVSGRTVFMRKRRSGLGVEKPKKWDFGCVRLGMRGSLRAALASGYREKYGLEIEVLSAEKSPPISDFSFRKLDCFVAGFVLPATLKRDANAHCPEGSERAWVSLDDPPPDGSVPDAQRVFEALGLLFHREEPE